jgi:hypothetical protein
MQPVRRISTYEGFLILENHLPVSGIPTKDAGLKKTGMGKAGLPT